MFKMFKKRKEQVEEVRPRPESIEERFADPILIIKNVNFPYGVAVKSNGEIVISEQDGHCVSIYSPKNEKLKTIGSQGKRDGSFTCPAGVVVDREDYIHVVDKINNRVQRFMPDGMFVTVVGVGPYDNGPVKFNFPSSIAFNPVIHSLFVSDSRKVQILNLGLGLVGRFGDADDFESADAIACDNTGNVYIADNDSHVIKVFTYEGKLLRQFGKHGEGKDELKYPSDMAVDSTRGLLYISDNGNHRVSVFTTEGNFVTSFGKEGGGPGEMKRPHGIAVDASGVVYLCDTGRVQVF